MYFICLLSDYLVETNSDDHEVNFSPNRDPSSPRGRQLAGSEAPKLFVIRIHNLALCVDSLLTELLYRLIHDRSTDLEPTIPSLLEIMVLVM